MQPWTRRRPTGSAPRAWPGWCSRWSAGWAPSATTPTGCSGGRELMTGSTRHLFLFVCFILTFIQVRHEGPQPRNGSHCAGWGSVRWDGFWNAGGPSRTREVSITMDADYLDKGPTRSTLTLKRSKLKGYAQALKFINLYNWENFNDKDTNWICCWWKLQKLSSADLSANRRTAQTSLASMKRWRKMIICFFQVCHHCNNIRSRKFRSTCRSL